MPFRLDEFRAKVQFVTSAQTPSLIRRAAEATGRPSNTVYLQHAVCEALSRDLDIPLSDLLDALPPPKGNAAALFGDDRKPISRRRRHRDPLAL
jgi:hypothetical protein